MQNSNECATNNVKNQILFICNNRVQNNYSFTLYLKNYPDYFKKTGRLFENVQPVFLKNLVVFNFSSSKNT